MLFFFFSFFFFERKKVTGEAHYGCICRRSGADGWCNVDRGDGAAFEGVGWRAFHERAGEDRTIGRRAGGDDGTIFDRFMSAGKLDTRGRWFDVIIFGGVGAWGRCAIAHGGLTMVGMLVADVRHGEGR